MDKGFIKQEHPEISVGEPLFARQDIIWITERILCQHETILRINGKLLDAISNPIAYVDLDEERERESPDCKP